MSNWPTWSKILVIVVVVFGCISICCCLALAGVLVYSQQVETVDEDPLIEFNFPTFEVPTIEVPQVEFPTQDDPTNQNQSTPQPVGETSEAAWETLRTLEQAIIPVNDLRELAKRLGGMGEIPLSVEASTQPAQVGESRKFWVSNLDTDENFQIDASLRVSGEHVYFWVENGVNYSIQDIQVLVDEFDQKIYPTNRNFFGSENSPGVDNDLKLYILYASNIGRNLLGYFSSADAVHPLAHEFSNGHEMFVISADNLQLDDQDMYGTLAHEFQHMIHWNLDRNEELWVNEGFSELASFINGYDPGSAAYIFASNPDLQLNYWPDYGDSFPHYGSSYLFVSYILDQFGSEITQALVKDDDNGMDSLDKVLDENNFIRPTTNEILTADEVYADWAVANLLNDPDVANGQYAYTGGADVPSFFPEETQYDCPLAWQTSQVNQYGSDYIEFTCDGSFTLQFQGVNEVGLLPEDPFSGDYAFWSNRGDESDMTMTRDFDFTSVSGNITLDYHVWYEIEEGWDYAYLVVSEDNGQTWTILETPSGTDYNPQGNAYGWGYTGSSNGWRNEEVDLSAYAGKTIQIRFEYITDGAVNLNGLMLDAIQVETVGYTSDFETDEGGWLSEGFVRVQNRLPQTFAVSVVTTGRNPAVQTYLLTNTQQLSVPIQIGGQVDSVILVVSGTTRFTIQPAIYRYQVTR